MCKWHYHALSHQKFRGFNLRKSSLLLIWNVCSLCHLNKFPQLSFFKDFLSCYTLPRSCWNGHYLKAFQTWKEYHHDITDLRSTNSPLLTSYPANFAALPCFLITQWYRLLCSCSIPFHWMSLFVLIFLLSSFPV